MQRLCGKLRSLSPRITTPSRLLLHPHHRPLHCASTSTKWRRSLSTLLGPSSSSSVPFSLSPVQFPSVPVLPSSRLNSQFPINASSKKSRRRLRQPSTVPAAYAKVMKKLNFFG